MALSTGPSLAPPEWVRTPDLSAAYAAQIGALGFLVSPLTHELNGHFSPILTFMTEMEDLAEIVLDAAQRSSLAAARRAMDEALQILRSANRYGRQVLGEALRVKPADLLAEAELQLRAALPPIVQLFCPPHCPDPMLLTHPYQLVTGLLFLARRACRTMPNGGTLTLTAGTAPITVERPCTHLKARYGTYTTLSLTDEGTPIPADRLRDLFIALRSQSPEESAESWELCSTFTLLRRLSCGLSVEAASPQGTTATVFIPRTPSG